MYSIRGSSNHSYTSEGDGETLKKQWMSYPYGTVSISWADLMSEIWLF